MRGKVVWVVVAAAVVVIGGIGIGYWVGVEIPRLPSVARNDGGRQAAVGEVVAIEAVCLEPYWSAELYHSDWYTNTVGFRLEFEIELRRGAEVVDAQQAVSTCKAAEGVLPAGPCGEPVRVEWAPSMLADGQYEVWTRARWTDGIEEFPVRLVDEPGTDGRLFQLVHSFNVGAVPRLYYFPIILRGYSCSN